VEAIAECEDDRKKTFQETRRLRTKKKKSGNRANRHSMRQGGLGFRRPRLEEAGDSKKSKGNLFDSTLTFDNSQQERRFTSRKVCRDGLCWKKRRKKLMFGTAWKKGYNIH